MENETINIGITRDGLLNLIDAENFIRETITRYEALGPLFVANYSSINYHQGRWRVEVTLTTRDPNAVTNVLDFGGPAVGNW
jgi:hypothetical protein